MTSTKGVTGHLLGAAGAVEAAFAILAMREGARAADRRTCHQDPDIPSTSCRAHPREVELEAVLSTSMGFGGQNAALVLTRA